MKKFWALYICTWKYDVFRKEFYDSCEKYLLRGWEFEKHYFVWTDSDKIKWNDRVHVFYQENLWWPDNTLKRFHIFLSQEKELEKMDYLFFFNANLELKTPIWKEILPKNDDMIVVTKHPWFFNKNNIEFTYDRNVKSTACIKRWEWSYYVAWWLNWWTNASFLNMCKILSKNIDIDESNWVIALRHDESHLNRYIYDLEMDAYREKFMILPPSFLYPEGRDFSFPCKILIRDKSKYIAVNKIKNARMPLKHFMYKIWHKILWCFNKL